MNFKSKVKKFEQDKSAVFGLTSVQAFFAIILAVSLLAYVIVIIMGTLSNSTIIPTQSATTTNEAGFLNSTTYTLSSAGTPGFSSASIRSIINTTSGLLIPSSNYTLSASGVLTNTSVAWPAVSINYTYSFNSIATVQTNNVLGNVSTGITSFFGAINPVYAILAVLVIILVLVVLVRVVTGRSQGNRQTSSVPL